MNILKEKLYSLPDNFEEFEYFPSPNKLRNRVLIKDKGQLPSLKLELIIDSELTLRDLDEEDSYMSEKYKNFNKIHIYKTQTFFRKYHNIIQSEGKRVEEMSAFIEHKADMNLIENKKNSLDSKLPDQTSNEKMQNLESQNFHFDSKSKLENVGQVDSNNFQSNKKSQSVSVGQIDSNKKSNEGNSVIPNSASARKSNLDHSIKENVEKIESASNLKKNKKAKEKCEKLQKVNQFFKK
jgi:hypothetical protein